MTFLEVLGITGLSIVSVLLIVVAVISAVSFKNIKESTPRVRIKGNSSMICYLWTAVAAMLAAMNVLSVMSSVDKADIHMARAYLYLACMWITIMMIWLSCGILCTYSYITTEGIMTVGNYKTTLTPENITYKISDEKIEIIHPKRKRPIVYRFKDDKTETLEMLEEYYTMG